MSERKTGGRKPDRQSTTRVGRTLEINIYRDREAKRQEAREIEDREIGRQRDIKTER